MRLLRDSLAWAMVIMLLWGAGLRIHSALSEASVPPRSGQPHTDTFIISGYGDLQQNNAVTQKAKNTRLVTYGFQVAQGCIKGTIETDFQAVTQDVFNHWKLQIVRNDASPDFWITVNCGGVQVANCGSVSIFCVMGKPYYGPYDRPNASISDILNTYPAVTRRSILCHEICGHAILTWNEQYCTGGEPAGICKGLSQFTSAPNWNDIMNTGPGSRHDLSIIEDERADRTLYPLLVACSSIGYDECTGRWYQPDGFSWYPASGYWYNPQGQPEWSPCDANKVRWNPALKTMTGQDFFYPQGSGFYLVSRGYYSFSPAC